MKKTVGIVSAVLVTTSLIVQAHAEEANKSIYFNGGSLYNQIIYQFNPDTMKIKKVTPGTSADLSPDGTKLAFIKNDSLFISDANGKNQVRLTHSRFPTYDSSPRWSPDGKKIVFAKSDGNLYLIDVASKKVTALTHANKGVRHGEPDWSPNGAKIVFHSSDESGYTHIYTMNANGSNIRQLTGLDNNNSSEYSPHYSPDGSKILYGVTKQGVTDANVMNADGSQPRNITVGTNKAVASAVWSEDGKKILYTANDKETPQENHFYITNLTGSDNKIMKISVPFATPSVWETANAGEQASAFKKITNFFLD